MKLAIEEYLDNLGIEYRMIEHEPVFTVAESMEHLPDAFPVKNLLLVEEKGERSIFVIMKGDERLDTKHLATALDAKKLQFAKPEKLLNLLGVTPGSASLFNLLHNGSREVEIVVDLRLVTNHEVGFHPSQNTKTIFISGNDIESFLSSLERSYQIIDFDN